MRIVFFILSVLSVNAFADMMAGAVNAKMAFAPPPPTYQIRTSEIQKHFLGRTLSNQEIIIHNLTTVAETLKVESISSFGQNVPSVRPMDIKEAIIKKIQEQPKWHISLSSADVKAITPHLEVVKTTVGEKSYAWAWFLYQIGKTSDAKKILADLFIERSAGVMQMTHTNNHENPLIPIIQIEQSLIPLSTEPEKATMQKKMQELKVHVSNLKDFTIMT